jgi:hypothetical protein
VPPFLVDPLVQAILALGPNIYRAPVHVSVPRELRQNPVAAASFLRSEDVYQDDHLQFVLFSLWHR